MAIRAETEIRHDILGPMRLEGDSSLEPTRWVARPEGWELGGFEFYLANCLGSPDQDSILRAIKLSPLREGIQMQARRISGVELELGWIDCTTEVSAVALFDPSDAYLTWEGTLDENLLLTKLTTSGD